MSLFSSIFHHPLELVELQACPFPDVMNGRHDYTTAVCVSLRSSEDLHVVPCSGELRTQKLKSHLVRTQSLNELPLKPGVGQYIAVHATLTARDVFLAYFYPSGPFTCIFSKTSPDFFHLLAVTNTWFLCHHHHQSLNREGRWGTSDDFATSFLHFPLFSTALWDLPNSRPVSYTHLTLPTTAEV